MAVAGGGLHSLALKTDGQVVAWGNNVSGQATVPAGLSIVVAIAAGFEHSMALQSNGTVVAWGYSGNGQANLPANLSNVVAIAAGDYHSLALKADGTVVVWGDESTVPLGLTNVVAISGGAAHSLALVKGPPVITTQPLNQTLYSGMTNSFNVGAVGTLPLIYQWQFNGTNIGGATDPLLVLPNVQPDNAGNYGVVVANSYGTATSSNATLTVVTSRPIIIVEPTNETVLLGTDVTFTVQVTGSLPMNYQWQFSGTNIDGATNAALTVTNVQSINAGYYDVLLVNPYGTTASSNATLLPVPPSVIVGWGDNLDGYGNYAGEAIPLIGLTNVAAISAGGFHSLALKNDGTVVGWGSNGSGESTIPVGLSSMTAIAAGYFHSLALRGNGTVVAWGSSVSGETSVAAGLSNVIAVAAGGCDCLPNGNHSLALKNDGTVVGLGATAVPSGLSNVVAVAAGDNHSLALIDDGTITGWDYNASGQASPPAGLSNVIAIAAGGYYSMALESDGTVVAWGDNSYGQTNVPAGLSNVVAIAAGEYFSLALRKDGTVSAWGSNIAGETIVPAGLSNVVAIAAGARHCLAVTNDGSPYFATQPLSQNVYGGSTVVLKASVVSWSPSPLGLQWQISGGNIVGATNAVLVLTNVQPGADGNYTLVASNAVGTATTSPATLTVHFITVQPASQIVAAGNSPIFSVAVTGSGTYEYLWYFASTILLQSGTNSTLTLPGVSTNDSGNYTVVVTNASGSETSQVATLTVVSPQS